MSKKPTATTIFTPNLDSPEAQILEAERGRERAKKLAIETERVLAEAKKLLGKDLESPRTVSAASGRESQGSSVASLVSTGEPATKTGNLLKSTLQDSKGLREREQRHPWKSLRRQ